MTRSPPNATRRRRTNLLARTALSGALGVVALGSAPQASAGPMGGASPAAVAKAPTISTAGATTTVKLNQSNTIIDWKSFDISKGESVDFLFGSASGVVLNRVNGAASIDGALKGCVVTCQVIGGNVWLYASNGVVFGPNARVNVGSLLATTTPLGSDMSFLSGATGTVNFQGGLGAAKIDVAGGAQLAAHGGALALIAPEVDTQAGSSVSAKGTVLLGAAQNFVVHFADGGDGAMDLIDFQVPASALKDGSVSATPLSVKGAVSGGSVVLAAVSRPSVIDAVISLGGTVTATGAKAGPGGDIVLTATGAPTTVQVGGALQAAHGVSLQAPDAGSLDVSGRIVARGANGQGGAITLGGAGTASTTLEAGGVLDASSTGVGQTGGSATLTGGAVSVAGQVLAQGPAGGGAIALGGGSRGQDPTVFDATTTTLAPTATIDASATRSGNGGRVTVWSNADTTFQGAILARGGPSGGDGGSAEVSGGHLAFQGGVDLLAPHGAAGTLLLDPVDVAITASTDTTDGSQSGTNPVTYTDYSSISVGAINTALQNANVVITADGQGSGSGTGKITFTDAAAGASTYTFNGTANGTQLTFNAADGFTFASGKPIAATNGLSLAFNSSDAFDLQGSSIGAAGRGPSQTYGSITVTGTTVALSGGSLTTSGGAVNLTATSGGLTLDGGIDAGSGTVALQGASITQAGSEGPGQIYIDAGALSATTSNAGGSGFITLAANNAVGTFAAQAQNGAITFDDASAFTVNSVGDVTGVVSNSSSPGGIMLTSGGVITVSALVDSGGGPTSLTGASVGLNANLNAAAGTVNLRATGGDITQTGGVVTAGLLNATTAAGSSARADITLTSSANAIQAVSAAADTDGNATAASDVILKTSTGLIVNSATTNLGNVTLDATGGALVVAGAVTATQQTVAGAPSGGTATLDASGDITKSGGSAVITAPIAIITSSGGAVSLLNANLIGSLQASSAATGLSLTNAQALTVHSVSTTSGAIALNTTGDLTISNALTAPGNLTLKTTGQLTSGINTVLGDYTVQAATFASGGGDAELSPVLAPASAFTVTKTSGGFDLGALNPTIAGAVPSTGLLTVTANGGAISDTASALSFGGFAITGQSVSVKALTANSGALSLSANAAGGALQINGDLSAVGGAGQTVTLSTLNGAIGQGPGDAITAGALNATAGSGAIALDEQTNAVSTLASLKGAGASFVDGAAAGLTLNAGTMISGGTGLLSVTNAGPIVVASGTSLSGTSAGSTPGVSLTASGSQGSVTFQGPVVLASDMDVSASGGVTFDGAVDGGYALTTGMAASAGTKFDAAVGANTALASLTAGAVQAAVGIATTGAQSLGALTLAGPQINLTSANGGISVGTVNGDGVAPRSLSVSAPGAISTQTVTVGGNYTVTGGSFSGGALAPHLGDASVFTVTQTMGDLNIASIQPQYTPGPLTGGIDLTASAGSIVSAFGGQLNTGYLSATGNTVNLPTINANGTVTATATHGAVTFSGAVTANGDVVATATGGGIAVNAALNAPGQSVTLSATGGAITESGFGFGPGGVGVTAGKLSAVSDTSISLSSPNAVQEVTNLEVTGTGPNASAAFFDNSPGVSLLTLDNASVVGGNALTVSAPALSLSSGGSFTGGYVSLSATGGPLTLNGTIDAGESLILQSGGALNQVGGSIVAGSVTASATGGLDLTSLSTPTVNSLSNTGAGPLSATLTGAGTTALGVVSSAGGVTLHDTAGALHLTGTVTAGSFGAPAPVSLQAAGLLDQTGMGAITGSSLSAQGGQGVVLAAPNNRVLSLSSLSDAASDATGVTFNDATNGVLSVGVVNGGGGGVTLVNAGGLSLTSTMAAGGGQAVTLTASNGAIGEAGGTITSTSLVANGTSIALGGANAIGTVTALNATGPGGASLTDDTMLLNLVSANSGSGPLSIVNTGGGIVLSGGTGSVGVGAPNQTVSLSASGLLSEQTGATINAYGLSATGDGVALAQGNRVAILTRLADTGANGAGANFVGVGSFTVDSATSAAGPVALTSMGGSLLLSGTGVSAPGHAVTLTATRGSVSQDQGGAVTAGILSGQAGTGFTLSASAGNAVAQILNVSSVGGTLSLSDTTPLQVSGAISAPSVTLASLGAMTQDAASAITASTLTATATGGLSLGGQNGVATLAALNDSGAGGASFNNAATGPLSVLAANAGASGNLVLSTAGSLAVSGLLTAGSAGGTQAASLTAASVSEGTGGALTAGALTGRATGGAFVLGQAGNAFTRLATLSAPGAVTLSDTQPLEIEGAVGAGGALSLAAASLGLDAGASLGGSAITATATGGPIALAGSIGSPGAVSLTAAGPLPQTAGTITAGSFQAVAQGGIALLSLSTPAVTSLSNSGSGDIDVALTGGATTSGAVSDPVGAVAITAPAALTFTGAVTAAGPLQILAQGALTGVAARSSGGSVSLTGAGVDFTGGGSGVVSAASTVTVAAGAGNAAFTTLSAGSSDVTVTGQAIGVSNALDVGRDLILTGTSFSGVALAPTFASQTGRDFLLTDTAGGLTFDRLYAPRNLSVVVTDPDAGDSAPLAGGSLTAGAGDISVTATSIALSGGVSAAQGGVVLNAGAGPIGLGGLVVAGPAGVVLNAAGSVTETGAGAIQAPTLTVASGGAIGLGGANAVASVSLADSGGGSVVFADTAPALIVQSVTSGAGSIVLSETGGPLTLASALVAPGEISLTVGGALTGGALTAQGGPVSVSANGVALSGDVTAASGVTLAAGSGPASLEDVIARGGDANLSGGAITVGDVTAQGSATLSGAGPVTAKMLTASTGALTLSGDGLSFATGSAATTATLASTGAIAFGTLASGAGTTLTATGAVTANAVTATSGAVSLTAASISIPTVSAGGAVMLSATGGDIAVPTLVSGGDASLNATGAVTLGNATVGGALTGAAGGLFEAASLDVGGDAALSGGALDISTIQAGGNLALDVAGGATLQTATAGGRVSAQVGGALSAQSVTATTGSAVLQAASLSLGAGTAGGSLSVATNGGGVTAGALTAGGDLSATSVGAIGVGALAAGQDATLSSNGGLTAASIAVGRNLALKAGGDVAVAALSSGTAGDLSLSGRDIVIGAASGAATAADRLATGPATTVELATPGQVAVDVLGPAALTQITAGGSVTLATSGGDLSVAGLDAGGSLTASASGGSARLGVLDVGSGPVRVSADLDVVMGSGAVPAASGMTLTAPTGALSVVAGRDALIAYANALFANSVSAGRNVYLGSTNGGVTLQTLSAGGSATVLGGAGLSLAQATTGGSLTATAGSGAATIADASVGGDLALTAAQGPATLGSVQMAATAPGVRTLTISASGDAVLGGATDGAIPGILGLAAPSRTLVNVLSTGNGGGVARVDVAGDATLSAVASNSGAVVVAATGAVDGAPAGGTLFSAATSLNVTAGGAATLGGQSTAGGQATVVSGATLTLDALSGADVTLRADDLTLTGLLRATQACSPSCAAPTLAIESRTGLLTVGDAPSKSGFASGGMTLDSGEIQRLQGDSVALYGGDTTNAAARGDLQVGAFTLNAAAIKSLGLYAGPANVVRIVGTVTPSAPNTGVLVVGAPDATTGWTPRSVYVSGSLGGSSSLTAAAAALQSVSLNSVRDTLIGGALFQSVVNAAEPAAGGATAAINITRGLPVGVQPAVADINRNLIVAGSLSLRSNGYIVQENTGSIGQQGGILLVNPSRQAQVLTLGRVSAPTGGQASPDVIDLSLNFYDASGGLITRQVAAASPAIDLGALPRSDYYRVNGCTIGSAGSCTPLPNTIVDIGIDKLVEGVQVASEAPEPTDDPTITGAGNEEIWRTPACDPGAGQPCR